MNIFLAGSTGVIDRSLLPMLLEKGASVITLVCSGLQTTLLEECGAIPAVAYAHDTGSLHFAVKGELVSLVQKRGFPIVGSGKGVWSFTHVKDAATAAAAAVAEGTAGLCSAADDEPAPVKTWLPALVSAVGGHNAKARRQLGWELCHPSWHQGFVLGPGQARKT